MDPKMKQEIISELADGLKKPEIANKHGIDIGIVFIINDHSKDEIMKIKMQKEAEAKAAENAEAEANKIITNNIELISEDIEVLNEDDTVTDKETTTTDKHEEKIVVISKRGIDLETIRLIVQDLKTGHSDQTSIAIKYKISVATVSRIKRVEIDHAYGIYKDYPWSRLNPPSEEEKDRIIDNMAKGIKPADYNPRSPRKVKSSKKSSSKKKVEKKPKQQPTVEAKKPEVKEEVKPTMVVKDKKQEETTTTNTIHRNGSMITNVAPKQRAANEHPCQSVYGSDFTLLRRKTIKKVGLVADRHDQPVTDYVFKQMDSALMFNYDELDNIANEWIDDNIEFVDGCANASVALYPTGLQCALAAFMKACYQRKVNFVLMHYNAENKVYRKQSGFTNFGYKFKEGETICPEKLQNAAAYCRNLYAYKSIDDILSQDIIYTVEEIYYDSNRSQLYSDTVLFADKGDCWFYFMEKSEEKIHNKSMFINVVNIADGSYKKIQNLAKKTT